MRVTLKTDGGMPPAPDVLASIALDTERIAPHLSVRLQELVRAAAFFHLPGVLGRRKKRARTLPSRTHTITVEKDGHAHQVVTMETKVPTALQALVAFIEAHGTRG
ncbi:protealysin inhibitor emfourin [Pendulispora albinea]|uniref:protealysin inhibitor emfourin n=1 Tax=Pendulispora albinea TaxID=2741071 RepID=UPI00374E1097